MNDWSVSCWGQGTLGQLGTGNTNHIGDDENVTSLWPAIPSPFATCPSLGSLPRPLLGSAAAPFIVAGKNFYCAVKAGLVTCWGANDKGQLGRGHTNTIGDDEAAAWSSTVSLPGPVSSIAAGDAHVCVVIAATGAVTCWGVNSNGALGLGLSTSTNVGDDVTPLSLGLTVPLAGLVLKVAAGTAHSCALLLSGQIACWGTHTYGSLGVLKSGRFGDSTRPATDAGFVEMLNACPADIVAGGYNPGVITTTGLVRVWGDSTNGVIGLAQYSSTQHIGIAAVAGSQRSPASTVFLPIVNVAVGNLAIGPTHASAVDFGTGYLRVWGSFASGQGGNATTGVARSLPSAAVSIGGIADGTAAGGQHTCVRLTDGSLRCFGRGTEGQLGLGNTAWIGDNEAPSAVGSVPLPLTCSISMVAASNTSTCVVMSANGGIVCFGTSKCIGGSSSTDCGVLGVGLPNAQVGDVKPVGYQGYTLPPTVDCTPFTSFPLPTGGSPRPLTALAGSGPRSDLYCALIEGTPVCWGANNVGQLGRGYVNSSAITSYVQANGDSVLLAAPVASLAVGASHVCALLVIGSVTCWGGNAAGQLGYGHTNNIGDDELPVTAGFVALPDRAIAIAATTNTTCAVLAASRQVLCWGANTAAAGKPTVTIGDDDLPTAATPLVMYRCANSMYASGNAVCAVSTDGVAKCWGEGSDGQLGNVDAEDIGDDEPVTRSILRSYISNVASVDMATVSTCFLSTVGNITCTGAGAEGQTGAGNTNNRLQTGSIVSMGGQVVKSAAGSSHRCSIMVGGQLRCFGRGTDGATASAGNINIGDDESPSSVAAVGLGQLVSDVAAAASSTCVILANGDVFCLGGSYSNSQPGSVTGRIVMQLPSPSPSPTPSTSVTPTPTATATSTSSATETSTLTGTTTSTGTATSTATPTATSTSTMTGTPSTSPTPSTSIGASQTPTSSPTPSITPSPAARVVGLALGIKGGSGGLIVDNIAGVAEAIRDVVASIGGIPPNRVAITNVNTTVVDVSGNVISRNSTLVNSTSSANAGSNATVPATFRGRRLVSSLADTNSSECMVARQSITSTSNMTRVAIAIAIDVSGLGLINGVDPAVAIAQRIAELLNTSGTTSATALSRIAEAWSNCTGVVIAPDQMFEMITSPLVAYLGNVAPAYIPASAPADDGLSPGAIVGIVIAVLAFVGICCFAAVCRRRRDSGDQEKRPSSPAASIDAGSSIPSPTPTNGTDFNGENPMVKAAAVSVEARDADPVDITAPSVKPKAMLKMRKQVLEVTSTYAAEPLPVQQV